MSFLLLQYFFRGISYLTLRIYLAARHYYDHVADMCILILTNCYGIMNLLLRKFTFTENQTFLSYRNQTITWSDLNKIGAPLVVSESYEGFLRQAIVLAD